MLVVGHTCRWSNIHVGGRWLSDRHAGGRTYMLVVGHTVIFFLLIDDRLYSAILRSLEQTHCARM